MFTNFQVKINKEIKLGSFSFSGFKSEWVKEPFSAFRLSRVPALASHESTRPFRNEWAFVSVLKNPVIDSAAMESKPIESATAGTVSGVQIAVVGIWSSPLLALLLTRFCFLIVLWNMILSYALLLKELGSPDLIWVVQVAPW